MNNNIEVLKQNIKIVNNSTNIINLFNDLEKELDIVKESISLQISKSYEFRNNHNPKKFIYLIKIILNIIDKQYDIEDNVKILIIKLEGCSSQKEYTKRIIKIINLVIENRDLIYGNTFLFKSIFNKQKEDNYIYEVSQILHSRDILQTYIDK